MLSVLVSAGLLALLYRSIDIRAVGDSLRQANGPWLVFSLSMIIPITLLRALRFLWVSPVGAINGFGEALRLTHLRRDCSPTAP